MARSYSRAQIAAVEKERRRRAQLLTMPAEIPIPDDMTFVDWCDELALGGLQVDGFPFSLADRPAMRYVYSLLPSTIEEAFGVTLVLQKCAQVGFTVMEMLYAIYAALKFPPCKVGMYLPDQKLAAAKSTERFMPVARTIPIAYKQITKGKAGEGNVMIRSMGRSRFHFLWTTGKSMTESFPMDVLNFDEVQEMTIEAMEKTRERLSASRIKFTLMGSTANFPDADINWWFKQGTQHQFHTICPTCETYHVMDEKFPNNVGFDDAIGDYRYVCPSCGGWIDDPQLGEWRAKFPDRRIISAHFTQFLSPTITPREIIEAFYNASDMKNFYNRKLGKPYVDPTQMPVTLEVLNECARLGVEAGLIWRDDGRQTFMGVDNMGGFSCVILAERMENGVMAITHIEAVYGINPWARLDVLMEQYGVTVCVCEQLPNYDSAKQFAARARYQTADGTWLGGHEGRVFLVSSYTNIEDNMIRWGDAGVSAADRKTDAEHRDRYTLSVDQYKMMSWALARLVKHTTLFPDSAALTQEVDEKGKMVIKPILRDVAFNHFTHTALVTEKDEEEHKVKRKVVKVGIDPHFSFAYMLLCAAWCRAYGTTTFILPTEPSMTKMSDRTISQLPPSAQALVLQRQNELTGEVCGRCSSFDKVSSRCGERDGLIVRSTDPGCMMFVVTQP